VAERRSLVLEVGCEEIPAPMIPKALDDLSSGLLEALGPLASEARSSKDLGGPRRLVVSIADLKDREEDREETVTGPPRSAAFDASGQPTRAALGFAKGQGVEVGDLKIVGTAKGDVIAARKSTRGRSTRDVLASGIPAVLAAMRFSKMMRWGDRGRVFVRPVRWILALLDADVVPFEFMGVTSGRLTHGHRFLGPGPHEIARAADYEMALERKGRVTVRIADRRRILLDLAEAEAKAAGGRLRPDPGLIEELTFLTEHPAVTRGSFPQEFLALPDPVLMTTMRHHQKYLTVEDASGRLRNSFIAVLTTDNDAGGLIRLGNEWVLRARLADARFFFEEDRKKKLEARVDDLQRVSFHARLGSYTQKIERMQRLARTAAAAMRLSDEESADAQKAALLAKADLTTGMVGEFPELQGVMGGIYARLEGLGERCARSIEEHYLPLSADDRVPVAGAPAVVAIADKVDTLAVCFAAGLVPRGSADPYALRRAAQGVLRTLIDNGVRFDLQPLLDEALAMASEAGFQSQTRARSVKGASKTGDGESGFDPRAALFEFLEQRLRFLLEESGIRHDAVRAVLATGWTDPILTWRRGHALNSLRGQDDFLALAAAAKRVRNILAQATEKGMRTPGARVDPRGLKAGVERDLQEAIERSRSETGKLAERGDFKGALSAVAALRPVVDRFFDEILVMDPDEKVRTNRLALLADLSSLLSRDADFAEIVVEGETRAEAASNRSGR